MNIVPMMSMKHIYRCMAMSVAAVAATAFAQSPSLPLSSVKPSDIYVFNYEHYTTDRGLTSNDVRVVMKDRTGLMWIGTSDGVNSFDGYDFRRYQPDPNDSTAISGKTASAIKEIDDNRILIAVADGDLMVYDKKIDQFSPFVRKGIERGVALGLNNDGDDIYIAYRNKLVKRNIFTRRTVTQSLPDFEKNNIYPTEQIRFAILPDNGKVVMLLGSRTLGIVNSEYQTIKEVVLPGIFINDICPINSSSVYLATSKGLYIYDINSKTLRQDEVLRGERIHAIARDYGQGFWLACDGRKIVKWVPQLNKLRTLRNAEWLINDHTIINAMFEDDNEILWVGTNNMGLFKFDIKQPKIRTANIDCEALPRNYSVRDIYASDRFRVWFACARNGVVRVDPKEKVSEHIPVPGYNVTAVFDQPKGKAYFGTTNGAFMYSKRQRKMWPVPFPESVTKAGKSIVVNQICDDCLGNVWFATNQGLFKYNGRTTTEMLPASYGSFNTVYEDRDGRVWAGGVSGSYVLDTNASQFVETGASSINVGNNNVTYCFCDYGNRMLIGTRAGVLVYSKETKKIWSADFNHLLGNSIVFSAVTDPNNVIWLSTSTGVGYIDPNYRKVYKFNHRDGLDYMGKECRRITINQDIIYTGKPDLVNFVQTKNVRINSRPPNTFVSGVTYGHSGREEQAQMRNDSLFHVKFLVNASLRIKLASSDFTLPQRNEFMYKVDNGDWVVMRDRHEMILSGMVAGTYKVQLRSTNCDKMWSESTRTIYIEIEPPLWGSKAAIIFYVIMIVAIIWLLLDFRFRAMNRKMKRIETEARAKKVVEAQRNRLAKIHKDQTDSINYAKRIQDSIMPKEYEVRDKFQKLFVLYKPKDIVSGDFYCFYHRDDKTFIVSADCTGHGVPGAFISILGIDHLSKIIMEQKEDDAGRILSSLHKEMSDIIFHKDASAEDTHDGMDLTICVVHHREKIVNFAGAMNDLYIIRNNEIITYRGDRVSIGSELAIDGVSSDVTYSSRVIECEPGDMFYLFSDGYVDQFGGPEQKKFKHRRFKHLLMNIHKLPAKDQRIILSQKYDEWRGGNEQTDDISVIGFEPWS